MIKDPLHHGDAVPGSDDRPADRSLDSSSGTETPRLAAPWKISSGENACMWICGTVSFTVRQISRYFWPV